MTTYETPGVYYERADASLPAIAPLRTDVAGLVGIALRGPLHTAVPVQSWRQFETHFGTLTGAGYLAYAVRAFFENGGQRCWVVRVASDAAATAGITLAGQLSGQPVWQVAASSPGVWGDDLDVQLKQTHRAQTFSDPARSTAQYTAVGSVAGFSRGTLVRLSQAPTEVWRVVSDVDAVQGRLLWVNPRPEARLPYDTPLAGFAADQPILVESVEYTLLVREAGRLVRTYEDISLVPEHPRYGATLLPRGRGYAPGLLDEDLNVDPVLAAGPQRGDDLPLVPALPASPEPVAIIDLRRRAALSAFGPEPLAVSPEALLPLTGGADGLALLSVYDWMGEEVDPQDSDLIKQRKRRGLRVLADVGEVSIVAVPDINIQPVADVVQQPLPPCIPDPCLPAPPAAAQPRPLAVGDLPPRFTAQQIYRVQAAMVEQCEHLRDRIALLDPPYTAARDAALGSGAARAWRSQFDSQFAAFYYPWLRVYDPLAPAHAITRDIPPSGHAAGQIARSDLSGGVHRAPANAALAWAQDVTAPVGEALHGLLNTQGINVLRVLPGRGIRIMGARTVSSDGDWIYINVRRLLIMIEKAIGLSLQWAVFEPNNFVTRAKIQLALSSFLIALWQGGALAGSTIEQAFFVRCNDANNPPEQRARGMLVAEVGVAPVKPFEFIVLRVGRVGNEFTITETSRVAGGM